MSVWTQMCSRLSSLQFLRVAIGLIALGASVLPGLERYGRAALLFLVAFSIDYALFHGALEWRRTSHVRRGVARALELMLPRTLLASIRHEAILVGSFIRTIGLRPRPGQVLAGRQFSFLDGPAASQRAWALVAITVLELPVGHLMLYAFNAPTWPHVVLFLLSVYGVVFIVGDLRLLREAGGHLVTASSFEVRLGCRCRASIPLESLSSVSNLKRGPGTRSKGTLRVTAGEAPNVALSFESPVTVTVFFFSVETRRLELYVDEPDALVRLLNLRSTL